MRFWDRAGRGKPSDCWLWTGALTGAGYGAMTLLGREVAVHRLVWEMERGPIPPGLLVLHKCDMRPCCNPRHLFLGTQADNVHDMMSKGRKASKVGALHHNAKMDEARVRAARRRRSNGERAADLAREYGVSPATMCDLLRGRTWSHV